MVELWNSEVGLKRVGMVAGTYRLVCTNGLGSWSESSEHHWVHRGASNRIKQKVQSVFIDLFNESDDVIQAYKAAIAAPVEDVLVELQKQAPKEFTEAQRSRIKVAWEDTSSNTGTFAGLIDAITLAAQEEPGLLVQRSMEDTATKILARFSRLK
jgi:hypothetical protein